MLHNVVRCLNLTLLIPKVLNKLSTKFSNGKKPEKPRYVNDYLRRDCTYLIEDFTVSGNRSKKKKKKGLGRTPDLEGKNF